MELTEPSDRAIATCGPFPLQFSGEDAPREVQILNGPYGLAECSPLPGYFDDFATCRAGAIATVSSPWPALVRDRVAVNGLIRFGSSDEMLRQAVQLVELGMTTLKVKVPDESGIDRVYAIRSGVGDEIAIRVDANANWSRAEAAEYLRKLEAAAPEYVEDPVRSLEALAELQTQTAIPLAADMLIRSEADALRFMELDAGSVLVVKIQPLGGLQRAYRIASEASCDVVVSSMMESSIGVALGVALACALPREPRACGLATGLGILTDVIPTPLVPRDGYVDWSAAAKVLATNSITSTAKANGCSK